jgi:hypothetical protein
MRYWSEVRLNWTIWLRRFQSRPMQASVRTVFWTASLASVLVSRTSCVLGLPEALPEAAAAAE